MELGSINLKWRKMNEQKFMRNCRTIVLNGIVWELGTSEFVQYTTDDSGYGNIAIICLQKCLIRLILVSSMR